MPKSILVGIDGTERGETALEWAAREAEGEAAALVLLSVIDPRYVRRAGGEAGALRAAVQTQLDELRHRMAQEHPALPVRTLITSGEVIDCLVEEADRHDLVVVGSHHGRGVGQTLSGARGLRVSVSAKVPTAVVPCDWAAPLGPDSGASGHHATAEGEGLDDIGEPAAPDGRGADEAASGTVLVAVGPDDVSDAAIAFGLKEALATGRALRLVSAWGLPALLTKPAETMGGGLAPVGDEFQARLDERVAAIRAGHPDLRVEGEAIEGPSPSGVLADEARNCDMLVMGTHSRGALGRTMFGSVTHSVLANLVAPTVIVPQR